MKNTAIIIPTRLGAKRFPNKPLAKIKNVPMIVDLKPSGVGFMEDLYNAGGVPRILYEIKDSSEPAKIIKKFRYKFL